MDANSGFNKNSDACSMSLCRCRRHDSNIIRANTRDRNLESLSFVVELLLFLVVVRHSMTGLECAAPRTGMPDLKKNVGKVLCTIWSLSASRWTVTFAFNLVAAFSASSFSRLISQLVIEGVFTEARCKASAFFFDSSSRRFFASPKSSVQLICFAPLWA